MIDKVFGVLALSLLLAAPGALAQQRLDERRPATADGTIKITNELGSVHVIGWDRDTVAITGMLDASAEGLDFSVSERETRIRVRLPENARALQSSQLVVNVPRRSHVAVRTSTADIEVRDVDGALDLESVSGALRISGQPRMIYAESAGGNVIVDAATKVLRAKSVSGDVTVSRALGYLEVSTVSGNARVQGRRVWEGEITSVSGDIYYEGDFDSGGSFYIESHSGAVELRLPATVAADFEITTLRGGSIENDFAPPDKRGFSTGGGGTRIRVKSFKGTVKLRRQG